MAMFRYLNPGPSGENIKYWLSKQSASLDIQEKGGNESKRGRNRTLKPLDEYFLVMCTIRQGFRGASRPSVSNFYINCESNFHYLDQFHVSEIRPS